MCSKRLLNRLIKKSFRAYNTAGELVFLILPHGEVLGAAAFQPVKEDIHGAFIGLVVLSGLAGVDELQQGDEVFLLRLRLIPDVANEGAV